MLLPKKSIRKQQRGRMTGKAWRGSELSFGDFGLKVMECGYITDRQIEASRIAMTRFIKRGGKVWLRGLSRQAGDQEAGRNPYGQRQGRSRSIRVAVFRPGKMLFEMEGVSPEMRRKPCHAAHKLPLKTMFVQRHDRQGPSPSK